MHAPWHNSRGSITLVALCLAAVIGISLASYLALCRQSQLLSTRTMQISKARHLADSSLEEALWSLNNNDWTTEPTWGSPTDLNGDGKLDQSETISGLDLGDKALGQMVITVYDYAGNTPTIKVVATVSVPGLGNFTKTLTATTSKPAPLFPNALGIINPSTTVPTGNSYAVIFNGAGLVDSWDSDYLESAIPKRNYSSTTAYPGKIPVTFTSPPSPYTAAASNTYPDLSFNYAAVVAAPNIKLNSAEIRGYAMTFGNPINYITGTGGSIVAAPPAAPGTPPTPPPNIDTTRVGKSAFVPSFTVAMPTGATSGPLDGSTSITINNSGAANPQIWDASPSDLTLNNKTVTIKGHVIIRVPGDLDLIFGGQFIVYQPPSPTSPDPTGRLEVYVGGNVRIGGATSSVAGFVNNTNEPKRLALFSLNTSPSRTFQYYTTQPFCGVMYSAAPASAKIDFQATSPEFFGAILANSNIEFNGSGTAKIHYDTALQYLPKNWFKGVTTPFIIVQLTES